MRLRQAGRQFVRQMAGGPVDPEVHGRVEVLLWFIVILSAHCALWALTHLAQGSNWVALMFAGFALATFLLLIDLWFHHNLARAGHLGLLIATAGVCSATFVTGGLRLTNVCPFFALILAAIFLHGRRGLGWAIVAIGAPLSFQAAHWQGYVFPDLVPEAGRTLDAFLTWFLISLVVLAFALLYERTREVSLARQRDAGLAKTEFLANLSHEIRTPLHTMMAIQEQLEAVELPAEQRDHLRNMRNSTESLTDLLTDLLELTRDKGPELVLVEEDFDPAVVFERVVDSLTQVGARKGLQVSCRVQSDTPRWVRGDPRRLRQVITNIGANAVRFTERGGVDLELRGSSRVSPTACVCIIRDSGTGIPPEERERVFERFVQLRSADATRENGTGLGLAIVRELVNSMGGRIAIDSSDADGTSFLFEVPFGPALSEAGLAKDAWPPAATGNTYRSVLLVDDNELNCDLTRLMLERMFAEVLTAASGPEAIAMWEQSAPDLILMDIQMPGLDGFEASKRIRESERRSGRQRVRIIAMTGYATDDTRARCKAVGIDDCLFKPFSTDALRATVG